MSKSEQYLTSRTPYFNYVGKTIKNIKQDTDSIFIIFNDNSSVKIIVNELGKPNIQYIESEEEKLKNKIKELEKELEILKLQKNKEDYKKAIKREPTIYGNITCPHCGCDSGIPMILNMVIPPEGLCCKNCGRLVCGGVSYDFPNYTYITC